MLNLWNWALNNWLIRIIKKDKIGIVANKELIIGQKGTIKNKIIKIVKGKIRSWKEAKIIVIETKEDLIS